MADILIIASGGGHTGFARAVAQYLEQRVDFVIPKGDEKSRKILSPYAERIYEVEKGIEPNSFSALKLLKSLVSSSRIRKYKVVVATGSNHSLFPSFFQFLKGAKVFAIESQDRIVTRGKAVSVISKYSRAVFLHWEEQKGLYKNGLVVGPIVEKSKYESRDEGYVLVTAGTEGFLRLFDKVAELGVKNVVMQTGKVDPSKYKREGWKVFSFDPDLERYIANASLVVTHQGKTAMEAVVMYGKPTAIVYNSSLVKAATQKDVELYAKILGAKFFPDPVFWRSNKDLLEFLERPTKPNSFTPGTGKLAKVVLSEAS
ncbi:MAG: UDP-N-acetylglucosamine, MurG, LPS N-acetylglucosamine transferase [Candidatus Aramenus sulfurataquae]|jgi:UDP-N-acetylglucosamine:LPS N-acetylglucosamine transferase|uniref:Polysaccharide biosynthesis protein n=2 Tax=Candidatus Aramenus sulfurataquae TaxID=1326980 RepID=W7KIM8_9CREN|nr:MAG: UDP-N-acetylglucosamine, MurG, LPS N-acetylglucosamine transferase [Candidatus Aramenus sulfurataquae]MCL7343963.1 polysaccharide biosynthesis protein [Candidatus Aramenus sulfurataquae]